MAYIPIPEKDLHYYGELPAMSGDSSHYYLSKSNIPDTAKEVLLYLYATAKGDEAFHRYYYRIETTDGKNNFYNQYMNVAASKDVSLNSANIWVPVFPGYGNVKVTLVDAEKPDSKGASIAHRAGKGGRGEEISFSQFFVLGYR